MNNINNHIVAIISEKKITQQNNNQINSTYMQI